MTLLQRIWHFIQDNRALMGLITFWMFMDSSIALMALFHINILILYLDNGIYRMCRTFNLPDFTKATDWLCSLFINTVPLASAYELFQVVIPVHCSLSSKHAALAVIKSACTCDRKPGGERSTFPLCSWYRSTTEMGKNNPVSSWKKKAVPKLPQLQWFWCPVNK